MMFSPCRCIVLCSSLPELAPRRVGRMESGKEGGKQRRIKCHQESYRRSDKKENKNKNTLYNLTIKSSIMAILGNCP